MATQTISALTADQQEAGRQLLQEDHALATEAASEQNQHSPGGDAGTELGDTGGEVAGQGSLLVVGGVVLGALLDGGSLLLGLEAAEGTRGGIRLRHI